ncbi:MAG TPA: hypothetical protein PK777_07070 [Thermoguttaceae bacterium]|nr:hypothetical protein [Thermoguttaceae bacterium]
MRIQAVVGFRWAGTLLILMASLAVGLLPSSPVWAQVNDDYYGRAVGGVSIDPEGVLRSAKVDATGQLR